MIYNVKSMNQTIPEIIPIYWDDQKSSVFIIDQTLLPYELKWVEIQTAQEMAAAIRNMLLRGAPLIGIAAAYGLVLALQEYSKKAEKLSESGIQEKTGDSVSLNTDKILSYLNNASEELLNTRPTAVNLAWALNEMDSEIKSFKSEFTEIKNLHELREKLLDKAKWIQNDDYERCKRMSEHALAVVKEELAEKIKKKKKLRVITHCNAGALATAGYGTALGLIRSLHREGLLEMVYADETRPRQQGSRLTAWELAMEGIPVTMICDTMSAFIMSKGMVDLAVVGSDRISANGDVANKIGTYQLAISANFHRIPFYVLAPESTVDFSLTSGSEIEIEYRDQLEVSHINGMACTLVKDHNSAAEVKFLNPGFDVTPNHLISGIITESGLKSFNSESLLKSQDLSLNYSGNVKINK